MILLCSGLSLAGPSANPPCPQLGFANGCNVIITLNSNGTASVSNTGQPAYDGAEDQLVGVINNSGQIIGSVTLSGSGIFGFDSDGAGEPGAGCLVSGGNPFPCFSGGPFDSSGYGGPNTTFTTTRGDFNTGAVNFTGGLSNGGTAWFSLEEAPSTGGFTVTGTTQTPEPGSLILLGAGLAAAVLFFRKRLSAEAAA